MDSLFDDLVTLSGVPSKSLDIYLEILNHQDGSSKNVVIVTQTKAAASYMLNKLAEGCLDGKINTNKLILEAPNGNVIRFIPVANIRQGIHGLKYKMIHFRRDI
mgnify:CR=1 FL=1